MPGLVLVWGPELDLSIPTGELIITPPNPNFGRVVQRDAVDGDWRVVLEVADVADGFDAIWYELTDFYVGDRHQFGADDYKGKARARLVSVQLQTDNDLLAPWGQDTTELFGANVRLGAGLLMRLSMVRVVAGIVVEWEPIWTGRVETWGDASAARGQIRTHVVEVVDTISDLANVPTIILEAADTWPEYIEDQLLPAASWLFGVDTYGDPDASGGLFDDAPQAAINRLDQISDVLGLVWRSLRSGRLVVHPAPWNTTHVDRYDNPLLAVYPDGLRFSYTPDFTDIEYIADDDQQPFGIQRTVAGIINSIVISYQGDLEPEVYAIDDPVSQGRYGVRPFSASWIGFDALIVDDLLAARAFAESQALPLRTTLDHEGFWSALVRIDHLDPVTVIHATSDEGLVVTGTGTVRNIVEERTVRGDGLLSWQSTIQIDLDATETAEPLLPVEDLVFVSSESPGNAGPSSAEFAWTNPTQPSITPTEIQYRIIGRSLIWVSDSYAGVGPDGTTVNWLAAGTYYTFQVRLIRRVNGVIVNASPIRQVRFFTPNRILPTPVPDGTDTDADIPDFADEDCEMEVDLQENDGTGWVTVDTFTGVELTDNGDGSFRLTTPIPNSFFNDGSIYRFRSWEDCGGIDGPIQTGPSFDPPDDWTDPCTTPPALSTPPFDSPTLLVYVPKICAPDIIREAISGIEATKGDAYEGILSLITDPDYRALQSIDDPAWSDTPGGIVAYGECPQIAGHTTTKTISIKANIADNSACVLGECAAMRVTCAPAGGGKWNAGASVTTVLGVASVISGDLDLDTAYVVAANYDATTGDLTLKVDGVEVDTMSIGSPAETIIPLPIWRVGAPPGSWITDFAVWAEDVDPGDPGDPAFEIVAYTTQSTGNGTASVQSIVPAGVHTGDVVVVIVRHDDPFGTLPAGFAVEESFNYSLSNRISVVTGIYDSAVHGPSLSFPYSGGTGLTRAIVYYIRGADTTVGDFQAQTDFGDTFYPTITAPSGESFVLLFGYSGGTGESDAVDLNGFTEDWRDVVSTFHAYAYSQKITSAGAVTGVERDAPRTVYVIGFFISPA